jgi:hypothetical protein
VKLLPLPDLKLAFSTHSPRSAAAESKEEFLDVGMGSQEDCSGEGVVVVVVG